MKVRTTGAVPAVLLGLLLAGCGSADAQDGEDVATLVSVKPPAPAASSAAPVPAERPLIRTDTSSEEEERLYDVWQSCLEDNGGGTGAKRKAAADAAAEPKVAQNVDPGFEERYKKAEKKCANKEPEELWERAKRLDPAYGDKLRDWVTCIRSHGIDAWESDGFLTFESLPPDNQMKKVDDCQDKAFGKG
ncbi:hypothetical protein [Actinoplanes sp. NPDC049265]|uniref:hypothetical protein n=1 Tax=Actinoplanes sp. NPDC049265 TaxID=3363902 RepID=UPI00371C02B3